jgi:ribose-phosphate pyrophosphokinase
MKFNITLGHTTHYEKFFYPAGEQQVRLKDTVVKALQSDIDEVIITARIRNGNDIMELALLKSAVDDVVDECTTDVKLVLPYLPYGRADRRFKEGDCAGLATFGAVINSMGFNEVYTWDAHNPEAARINLGYDKFFDLSASDFILRAVTSWADPVTREVTVLFPDKGASQRYKLPWRIEGNAGHYTINQFSAEKKRNPVTGVFEGFTVPTVPSDVPLIIVDDICDGGGTFLGVAKILREQGYPLRPALYVTHGIFSKGVGELNNWFDWIYTTNTMDETLLPGVTKYSI